MDYSYNKLLKFQNIEEIKFKRIKNTNLYSIEINSDIEEHKDVKFKADKCIIENSSLTFSMSDQYSDIMGEHGDSLGRVRTASIPMEIHLLINNENGIYATISKEDLGNE